MASVVIVKGTSKLLIDSAVLADHVAKGWKLAEPVVGPSGISVPKGTSLNLTRFGDGVTGLSTLVGFHYKVAPVLGTATGVHAAIPMTNAAQTVIDGIVQPDVPRLVSIKGNAAGNAGNVVIYGTNILGEGISETIALNGATEVAGTLAFKTVTSVLLPAETHAGTDTTSIGHRNVLGIPHILESSTLALLKLFDGSSDAGTFATDADLIEKNLFTPAGTLNGAKLVDLYYLAANT